MSNSKRKKKDEDLQVFKVRCAITMAHYRFVEAHDQDEAERMVEEYIRNYRVHCAEEGHAIVQDFDWEGEASHFHVTYEVEEA